MFPGRFAGHHRRFPPARSRLFFTLMILPEIGLPSPVAATTFRLRANPAAADEAAASMVSRLRQSRLFLEYQQAFESATGLPLILREAGSFRTPLQGSKRANRFCTLMTQTNKSCAACLRLQQRLEEQPVPGPNTLQCYAGLSESSVPVRVGEKVLGFLQTGQVFLQHPTQQQYRDISGLIDGGKPGADSQELKSAYFQTKVIPRLQYKSVLRLLAIFAQHLAAVSNRILMTEDTAEPASITKIRSYIAEHHSEALRLSVVAQTANMSVCYFCRIFKQTTGLTFTEYLARERIETVKLKLLNANMRVSEAAYAAGFQSLSQFNRVYRRVEGESPRQYRNRIHSVTARVSPRHSAGVDAA